MFRFSLFLRSCGFLWALGLSANCFGQLSLPPISSGPTSTEAGVVNEATVILQELAVGTATQIPENLLASAEGVVIVPHYVRGAFVIGIAGGRGVLLVRDANHQWQAPEFITLGGGSIGWQVGVQSTDLVLVFRTPKSVNNIRQGKLTLGVNASAAAGPIGRYASAATDQTAQAEILTYSKTRGLFAGVSLSGASLQVDVPATQVYYQTIGGGSGVVPQSAISLVAELNRFSNTIVPAADPALLTQASGNPLGTSSTPLVSDTAASTLPPRPMTKIRVPAGSLVTLENSVSALLANVDAQWQNYLSLPADWKNAAEIPADEVYATLTRYERVATNPQFTALRSLPSFEQALTALRELASQTPERPRLQLPPPPIVDAADVSRGRY